MGANRRFILWAGGGLAVISLLFALLTRFQVFAEGFHAVFAIFLGVTFTIAMAVGLMALTFHSNRSGHDDEIDPKDE